MSRERSLRNISLARPSRARTSEWVTIDSWGKILHERFSKHFKRNSLTRRRSRETLLRSHSAQKKVSRHYLRNILSSLGENRLNSLGVRVVLRFCHSMNSLKRGSVMSAFSQGNLRKQREQLHAVAGLFPNRWSKLFAARNFCNATIVD